MKQDYLIKFEASLIGRSCTVRHREQDWAFDLGDGIGIGVSVPWRIVSTGRISFASADHGHMFGRETPVDGEVEARELLATRRIDKVMVDRQTGDLSLHFDPSTRLDVFNNSSAYEGWQATCVFDGRRWSVVGLGGGEIAFAAG